MLTILPQGHQARHTSLRKLQDQAKTITDDQHMDEKVSSLLSMIVMQHAQVVRIVLRNGIRCFTI